MNTQNRTLTLPMHIVIEGNIGVGKSTFLSYLKKEVNIVPLFEPHALWQNVQGEDLLKMFYSDMPRWANTFQLYAYASRVKYWLESIKEPGLYVSERSLYSDKECFAHTGYQNGMMTKAEWHIYDSITELLHKNIMQSPAMPVACIYLRSDPEVCLDRVVLRQRDGENNISFNYLEQLHLKHESRFNQQEGTYTLGKTVVPCLMIDCDTDFVADEKVRMAYLDSTKTFIRDITKQRLSDTQ